MIIKWHLSNNHNSRNIKIIFNNWFDPEEMAASLKLSFKIAVGVSLIIYYLFLTAMAQANSKSWKEFFKKTSFSFSRIYYFTPIFLINLSLIALTLTNQEEAA